jgi:hypothetical protein
LPIVGEIDLTNVVSVHLEYTLHLEKNCKNPTYEYFTLEGIIEPLNELNNRTLSTSRRANESYMGSRFNLQIKLVENRDAWSGRVAEADVSKLYGASDPP